MVVAESFAGNARDGRPCDGRTRLQASSISKQFVAVTVLSLVERGRLRLDDALPRLIPHTPRGWHDITLHHLLSCTSGLVHWNGLPSFDVSAPPSPDDLVAQFADVALLDHPGARWSYSGPGYVLAARAVEEVTDETYAHNVTQAVLDPAGLTATSSGVHDAVDAAPHRNGARIELVAGFTDLVGTGDLWTTPADLNTFSAALRDGRLLDAGSLQAMTTAHAEIPLHHTKPGDPMQAVAYGYGVYLGRAFGHRAHFHPGDNPGYRSLQVRLVDTDLDIAVLGNDEAADVNALAHDLLGD